MTVLAVYVIVVVPVITLLMGWGALRLVDASWKREEARARDARLRARGSPAAGG